MALDGDIVKQVNDQLGEIKTNLFAKVDQLEKEAKKRGEDAVTHAEVKKLGDAIDTLKDKMAAELKKKDEEINALHRKANRSPVASVEVKDSKTAALEAKANAEFARWVGVSGDASSVSRQRGEYKKAWESYLRKGDRALHPDEAKALSVGSAPDGGYYVDPARAQTMIDKLYETSALRQVAMQLTIGSSSYEEPIDRDEPTTGWVGEQSTRSETNTPQVGKLVIPVHEQYALVKATQNILDDAGINVEQWLDMKVNDELVRQENTAFVTGNGVNKPKGFTSYTTAATADASRAFGELEHVVTGSNGAFRTASATVSPADDLIDLIGKFKAGYRSRLRWGGNRITLTAVRKFKDQNGNFIYDASASASGIRESVLGYAWDEFADMATYTTTGALGIVLADWSRGYIILDRQGVRQLRDPYTQKGYVLFYTYKRVGGGCRDSDAIKFVKFSS